MNRLSRASSWPSGAPHAARLRRGRRSRQRPRPPPTLVVLVAVDQMRGGLPARYAPLLVEGVDAPDDPGGVVHARRVPVPEHGDLRRTPHDRHGHVPLPARHGAERVVRSRRAADRHVHARPSVTDRTGPAVPRPDRRQRHPKSRCPTLADVMRRDLHSHAVSYRSRRARRSDSADTAAMPSVDRRPRASRRPPRSSTPPKRSAWAGAFARGNPVADDGGKTWERRSPAARLSVHRRRTRRNRRRTDGAPPSRTRSAPRRPHLHRALGDLAVRGRVPGKAGRGRDRRRQAGTARRHRLPRHQLLRARSRRAFLRAAQPGGAGHARPSRRDPRAACSIISTTPSAPGATSSPSARITASPTCPNRRPVERACSRRPSRPRSSARSNRSSARARSSPRISGTTCTSSPASTIGLPRIRRRSPPCAPPSCASTASPA